MVQTLEEFKKSQGVQTLRFYQSTKSEYLVAGLNNKKIIISKPEAAKTANWVYQHPENDEVFILSTTKPKDCVLER